MWAVVNGKEIQRAEVEKYFRTRVNAEGPAPSQEEALSLKLNILDELVNNEILLERASKLNLIASDAEVEDKFTESKSPYTEEEFQKKLKDSGLTVDDLEGRHPAATFRAEAAEPGSGGEDFDHRPGRDRLL